MIARIACRAEPTTRVELVTSSLPRTRSGQLSYVGSLYVLYLLSSLSLRIFFLHRSMGILPGFGSSLPAERETGFEPATSSLEGWSSTN